MQLKPIVFIPAFDTETKVTLHAGTKPVSPEYQSLPSSKHSISSRFSGKKIREKTEDAENVPITGFLPGTCD